MPEQSRALAASPPWKGAAEDRPEFFRLPTLGVAVAFGPMTQTNELPALMAELHGLEFDYADGEGIDFEPYQELMPPDETAEWFKAWTGNPECTARAYRIFGQDGSGGYAAFWLQRDDADLLEQPIVFFGSEGELGVVARNFSEYLWLLAGGYGPYEAVEDFPELEPKPEEAFVAFARRHAPDQERTPHDVVQRARAEFPTFERDIQSLCR
jgi:hypothetical protein